MKQDKDKFIKEVFDDAMERAWEEAKLCDFVTLYHMWERGAIKPYETFDELLNSFNVHHQKIREMDDKEYYSLEHLVVDAICKEENSLPFNPCED
jgi:hypothetical protein